jgi:hypothetical protein
MVRYSTRSSSLPFGTKQKKGHRMGGFFSFRGTPFHSPAFMLRVPCPAGSCLVADFFEYFRKVVL